MSKPINVVKDWNDLHCVVGLNEVKKQLLAAITPALANFKANLSRTLSRAEPVLPENSPPSKQGQGEVVPIDKIFTLAILLKRFALIEGETKVFDSFNRRELKKNAFELLVTPKLAKEWYCHNERKLVAADTVRRVVDGSKLDKKSELMPAVARYIYLDGTQEVWDKALKARIPAAAVRLALGDAFKFWINSPDRKTLPAENVVFDPKLKVDPEYYINTFEGLPLTPKADLEKCKGIRYLIDFLCNFDKDAAHWLTCWLAYPLQNIGAKLDTSILFHSTLEGSGKSLLFSRVMRMIYGEYGAMVGQSQLESNWTGWQSNKLYGVFEEVVSHDQRYNQVGKIKNLVTGETMRIESKFMNGWEEVNYMNTVFLSNEMIPWPISENDRRMFVIWPKEVLTEEYQNMVGKELKENGVSAFYQYLLDYDVGDFNERTKPLKTEARAWLVEASRMNWESFVIQWRTGLLGVPYDVASASDVYDLYVEWCGLEKIKPISQTKFSLFVKKHIDKSDTQIPWMDDFNKRRKSIIFLPCPPSDFMVFDARHVGGFIKAFRDKACDAGWNPLKWDSCRGWVEPSELTNRKANKND